MKTFWLSEKMEIMRQKLDENGFEWFNKSEENVIKCPGYKEIHHIERTCVLKDGKEFLLLMWGYALNNKDGMMRRSYGYPDKIQIHCPSKKLYNQSMSIDEVIRFLKEEE